MYDALAITLPFFLTGFLLPKTIKFCQQQQAIDIPNHRSSHTVPTPRGGGILLVLVATVTLNVLLALAPAGTFANPPLLLALCWLGVGLASIGWLDDTRNLPARIRLLAQLVVVAAALYWLPAATSFPIWVEKPVLLLAWVWFINLYNFMDGADGLAATEAAFIASGVALICPQLKLAALIVAGCALGFLRFNRPKALIFMGDTGSTWLGFVLGGLLLAGWAEQGERALFPLFTLPLFFTADATYTLLTRLIRGKKPWQAHREHWYQRALQMGMTHSQLLIRASLLNAALLLLAVVGYATDSGGWTLLLALLLVVSVAQRIRWLEGGKT